MFIKWDYHNPDEYKLFDTEFTHTFASAGCYFFQEFFNAYRSRGASYEEIGKNLVLDALFWQKEHCGNVIDIRDCYHRNQLSHIEGYHIMRKAGDDYLEKMMLLV